MSNSCTNLKIRDTVSLARWTLWCNGDTMVIKEMVVQN